MAGTDDTEFVLVTEYFHPDTASTGQLLTDLAVGLEDRGLDMTVYTGQPNYHGGDHERQPRRETHEGVDVRRIRAPQVRQSSFLRRGFNWVVFTAWMVLVLLVDSVPDDRDRELVFVSNPPFLPPALWLVCRLRGWGYTYVVYDLYPDFVVETGYVSEGGVVDRGWSWLTARAVRDANHVVALGPVMRERIVAAAGPTVDPSKVVVVHNWEDEEFVVPRPKDENPFCARHGLREEFVLLYSGNVGENHDLETVVRAVARLAEEGDAADLAFLVIGEGDRKDRVVALAEELGVRGDHVRFLPYQPREELPYSLTAGDVSVVTVEEGMEGVCVSSKLYTSLAAGRPVLVVSAPDDDEARIVTDHDAGLQARQGDVAAVAGAIRRWRGDPELVERQGENARAAFEAHFTKGQSVDRYYRLLSGEGSVDPLP